MPYVAAIGGPGGTGKSSFTMRLAVELKDAVVVHLDDYKTPRAERASSGLFGAHPKANRIELIKEHLQSIRRGEDFNKPVYNAVTGEADKRELVSPAKYVLLDGEISTYKDFRNLVDISVFIDSDWKTQLKTRVNRDIEERGYSKDKAIATFLSSNLREFEEFGASSKEWADIHLYCSSEYHLRIESVSEELYQTNKKLFTAGFDIIGFEGLILPLLTTFDKEGNFDEESFVAYLRWVSDSGVKRVLVGGTSGEFFAMTIEERRHLLACVCRFFPGLVIYNASRTSLHDTIAEIRWAADFGVDAVMVLPPYYPAGLTEGALQKYFKEILNVEGIPVFAYNNPENTGNAIPVEVVRDLPFAGVKDTSLDEDLCRASDLYFAATVQDLPSWYKKGAAGFISSGVNLNPSLFVALDEVLRSGNEGRAAELSGAVDALVNTCAGGMGTKNIKRILSGQYSWFPEYVRLPL